MVTYLYSTWEDGMPNYHIRITNGDGIVIEDDRNLKELAIEIDKSPYIATKERIVTQGRSPIIRDILIYSHAIASLASSGR